VPGARSRFSAAFGRRKGKARPRSCAEHRNADALRS